MSGLKFKRTTFKSVKRNAKELTKSPISGTYIIKDWHKKTAFSQADVELEKLAASFAEITPETRAKIRSIPNLIGPYECKLCRAVYADAFELAMHNCPRVVHIGYKCDECYKVFNCPANLASHKRWHRPRDLLDGNDKSGPLKETKFQNEHEPIHNQYQGHYNSYVDFKVL